MSTQETQNTGGGLLLIHQSQVEAFLRILVENTTQEQHRALLQAYTNAVHKNGECPACGTPDVPIDRDSKVIEGDDVSMASEWIEEHDDDCPVYLFEQEVNWQKAQEATQ